MILIEELRKLNAAEHYAVTEHARIRLYERGITLDDVMCCVANGEIIGQYRIIIFARLRSQIFRQIVQ